MTQNQPIESTQNNQLFHQSGSFFNEEKLLCDRLNELLCPNEHDSESNWTTPLGQNFLRIRGLSLSHFIRQRVYKDFKGNLITKQWKREITEELKLQGDLISQLWKVIRLLPLSPNPRPDIFYRIIDENTLIFFNYLTSRKEPVTALIKEQQNINSRLMGGTRKGEPQDRENPFNEKKEPETFSFVDNCLQLIKRSDFDIEPEYDKLIRLRMKLITLILKSRPQKYNLELKPVSLQGRKSIGVSRKPSQ